MKSAFICNQNQARSQILSAVFSRLLTPQNFLSFGLIAKENTYLPQVIEGVFKDWCLNPSGRFARNIELHRDEVLNLDVVFVVTTFIAEELLSMGFKGQIVDLEVEAALLGVEVMDPQLMPRKQCAFELAKYVKVSYSALQKMNYIQNSQKIRGLIPDRESSIVAALDIAIATRSKSSAIVYGDLVAPRNDLIHKKLGLATKYSLHNSIFELHQSAIGVSGDVLVPANSVMSPSSVYLGNSWRDFLQKINVDEIILITPPMSNPSGLVAESYLAALPATEIHIVKQA